MNKWKSINNIVLLPQFLLVPSAWLIHPVPQKEHSDLPSNATAVWTWKCEALHILITWHYSVLFLFLLLFVWFYFLFCFWAVLSNSPGWPPTLLCSQGWTQTFESSTFASQLLRFLMYAPNPICDARNRTQTFTYVRWILCQLSYIPNPCIYYCIYLTMQYKVCW